MSTPSQQIATSITPLVEAIGGSIIPIEECGETDFIVEWGGEPVLGVRLAGLVSLERLIATVEEQLGAPLSELNRVDKQKAVRMLDERGAFLLRKSIEDVGVIMDVSRITIYNYLNATKNGSQ